MPARVLLPDFRGGVRHVFVGFVDSFEERLALMAAMKILKGEDEQAAARDPHPAGKDLCLIEKPLGHRDCSFHMRHYFIPLYQTFYLKYNHFRGGEQVHIGQDPGSIDPMSAPKGKVIALMAMVLGIATLAALGVSFYPQAVEFWYIRELESKNESRRRTAAQRLAEMESANAVLPLVQVLETSQDTDYYFRKPAYVFEALGKIDPEWMLKP